MNIFLMVLLTVFMVGYYVIHSPSQQIQKQETTYAIEQSDLRSVAECAAAKHNAQLKGWEFNDVCAQQNEIVSEFICLNRSGAKIECVVERNKRPYASYIITTTAQIPDNKYNDMMEILEDYFADAGTFGIFADGQIVSGATAGKRKVPKAIIEQMKIQDGQLAYLTQYQIPDTEKTFSGPAGADVVCPAGTVKIYRFGRWQCTGYNTKTNCAGDTIWDSDLMECVADELRRPLCAQQQTAVLVDNVWECIDPFPAKTCPDKMIARLNYTTLEWECIADPNSTPEARKCRNITNVAVYGTVGTTLRVPSTTCTDCEKMITDEESCLSVCVPDPAQINNPRCYAGNVDECSGASRAFYFGFPNLRYTVQIPELDGKAIPMDAKHSQNRMFNCMDCGAGEIDTELSTPPYTAICK